MKRAKVLLFPSGTEGALEIYDSLKYNLHFELYGFSVKENYTDFLYPKDMYLYTDERLMVTHPYFETALKELILSFGIEFIIPTFDNVAEKLAEIADRLPAKVVTSPYNTAVTAGDKRLTYEALNDIVPIPKVYKTPNDVESFPVFVKPAKSYGSIGASLVSDLEQLLLCLESEKELLICEHLSGDEITVDCFTDRHGTLRFIGPRNRKRIVHGMTYRGETLPVSDEINYMAQKINDTLSFRGAWYFQAKRDSQGNLKLLEFSVRQPTNSSLYSHLGVNFSALSLFDAMDMDVDIIKNNFTLGQERRTTAAYKADIEYDTVYIDFDDTLTTHDKVNTGMMKLLYQFFNKGKKLVLISCHNTGDLYADMKHFCIPAELFDEIIWIKDNTPKYVYMTARKAVFIDNYFKARAEVRTKCGIPVFDVDAADCLFDYSEF